MTKEPNNTHNANNNGFHFSADYLAAKKEIDDTALNQSVLQRLTAVLRKKQPGSPLEVLEVGAGIGTMLMRLLERGIFTGPVIYRLTDSDAAHLESAKTHLSEWAEKQKNNVCWSSDACGTISLPHVELNIILEQIDILEIPRRAEFIENYGLLIAHAVLDLFDLHQVLPSLLTCLSNKGLAYFTCNFDNDTIFLPQNKADSKIFACYHQSMEKRNSGASQTGRRLLAYLNELQNQAILAAGSSDWIIHPAGAGYKAEQKFFLHTIIDMIEQQLIIADQQTAENLAWLQMRRQQTDNSMLLLLAKHLDVLTEKHHL